MPPTATSQGMKQDDKEIEELRAKAKRGEQAEAHLKAIVAAEFLWDQDDEGSVFCAYCDGDWYRWGEWRHKEDCESPIVKARQWLAQQWLDQQEGRKEESEADHV